jgi:RNA polymerase sigma-70 factor (ECF subfamily)
MQETIERAYVAGQREWPGVRGGTLDAFERHVQELGTSRTELERHGRDLYLALALGMGDHQALLVLKSLFFPPLDRHLGRCGFDQAARDDVFQQVLLHLCTGQSPRILSYAGRAALCSWLRVSVLRFALNLQAKTRRGAGNLSDDVLAELVCAEADPERQLLRETARPQFQSALQEAVERLTVRDRTLLRLYFVDGLGVDALGKIYGVHRATAARWMHDIRQRILREVRCLLAGDSGVHASEFTSLALLVQSQLHLSLGRLLHAV